ncbi:hypothetical protein OG530_19355 [Streptomyces decoyicus]|uniref:hypothetical protein n=1 Tax=Streptomyces decoyicus TaxID=249567 RepID=UPI002E1964E7
MATSLPNGQTVIKTAGTYARDLVERIISTFLQGLIGGIVISAPLDLPMWHAAVIAGVAAVLALIKGIAARWTAVKNSASFAAGV